MGLLFLLERLWAGARLTALRLPTRCLLGIRIVPGPRLLVSVLMGKIRCSGAGAGRLTVGSHPSIDVDAGRVVVAVPPEGYKVNTLRLSV